ncbi:iron-containing redox enzyme family protein [Amycolatopsis sp. YIM 10]|uniref:iron-containing redox enzyme family protein n=1 Tax=Amycolatopsis sp. YIM 10 TaxID=2653857 RepID=UPI001D15CDA2|nr:iron-containing redox enzyme family protein [Amycolatopsis sp. YIM 10]
MTVTVPSTATPAHLGAALPAARGPISAAVVDVLGERRDKAVLRQLDPGPSDAFGEDVQVALHVCYELHYRGFREVAAEWEWEPELLRLRAVLERDFVSALRREVAGGDDVTAELDALLVEPVPGRGLSHFLCDEAEWWQVREFFAHRSIYHLKEADPHAWVIPRLSGRPKAALVAVEFDEFGGGHPDRVHAQLYADLLGAAGLSPDYLHYLESTPACMLAVVNLMSLFGLHRRWRGALVGHFTAAEITTGPSAQRLDDALARLGAAPECRRFYTEHIEADAVHEQVMRHEVVGGLLAQEPELAGDIVFGIQATELLEGRFAEHVLGRWAAGLSSLRSR